MGYPVCGVHGSPLHEMTRGHGMKSQDVKNSDAKNGVSRLWLGVAAAAGAAIAYLGDRERGSARRQAALRALCRAAHTVADRTRRWRKLVSTRLPGSTQSHAPAQVTVPTERGGSATAPSRPKRAERPAGPAADT